MEELIQLRLERYDGMVVVFTFSLVMWVTAPDDHITKLNTLRRFLG